MRFHPALTVAGGVMILLISLNIDRARWAHAAAEFGRLKTEESFECNPLLNGWVCSGDSSWIRDRPGNRVLLVKGDGWCGPSLPHLDGGKLEISFDVRAISFGNGNPSQGVCVVAGAGGSGAETYFAEEKEFPLPTEWKRVALVFRVPAGWSSDSGSTCRIQAAFRSIAGGGYLIDDLRVTSSQR